MSIKLIAFVLAWLALAISVPLAAQQTASASDPSRAELKCGAPARQTIPTQPASPQQSAQNPPAPPAADKDEDKDRDKDHPDTSIQGKVAGTSNDRLFFALPNFLSVENAGNVRPLTSGQKFSVVLRSSFDYVIYPWYGFLAGLSQAQNSEPGFGQGAEGYAKRYGTAFADGTIENFMTGAVFPSLLHQDPRFFQSGRGGFLHRAGYAVSRSFVTRTDSGHSQFNYSEIVGGALSAAISTYSYHPRSFTTVRFSANGTPTFVHDPSDRTLTNTASVWGTQFGYDTLTIVVKEFWPDIRRKISRKHDQGAAMEPGNPTPGNPAP